MNFTQQLLAELFTKAVNFKTVTVKNVSQGSTINVSLGYGSVRAQALQDISGDCIVFQTNQGNWYLIGNSVANQNSSNRTQSVYRKTGQNIEIVYPVITLVQSDWNTDYNSNPKPSGHKDVEYWLTGGGKYSLKRIVTKPLTLGFNNSEARLYFDGSDAFLQNAGNGKYLAATRSYELPAISHGGNPFYRNIFTIQKEDKSVVKIIPNFYGNFTYLGNGIYQSFIEDGIGRIFLAMGSALTANILPETSNFVIYNGELMERSGSLSIDLSDFNQTLDRTFAWRNKTIQHQIWLPTGGSTFNYSSIKTQVRNNLDTTIQADMYNYTFNETMSGEVLLMSWRSKYITSTFTIAKESKDWRNRENVNYYPWQIDVATKTEEITSKTEILTLKTYGDAEGEKNLVLNSNGKWLVLLKRPKQLNSDANLTVTKDTTHFRIKREIGYLGIVPVDYTPDYDLSSYVNENVITSFMIGNSAYIARGKITAIDFEVYSPNNNNIYNGRDWFTIEITQFKLIPKVETKTDLNDYDYRGHLLPFPWRIVLDNGCFWNYYLSHETTSVDIESLVTSYPYFQGGNTYSQLRRIRLVSATLLCDQFVKYIHTNPITVPFCSSVYYPPSILLIQDNLVGNSIYRVNDDILIQAYIESAANEWLGITKMPVSEWKISNNGDIKYNKTFLVDYRLKRPYYDRETDESLSFNVIPVTHSYHP